MRRPDSSGPGCAAGTAVGSSNVSLIPPACFVPVWRNQNLIIEIDGGEPRAVVLGWGGLAPPIAYLDPARCPSRCLLRQHGSAASLALR